MWIKMYLKAKNQTPQKTQILHLKKNAKLNARIYIQTLISLVLSF